MYGVSQVLYVLPTEWFQMSALFHLRKRKLFEHIANIVLHDENAIENNKELAAA